MAKTCTFETYQESCWNCPAEHFKIVQLKLQNYLTEDLVVLAMPEYPRSYPEGSLKLLKGSVKLPQRTFKTGLDYH